MHGAGEALECVVVGRGVCVWGGFFFLFPFHSFQSKYLTNTQVTVDLDVLARSRFLSFLSRETEIRPCTIVYATHIMDGLASWPTHLVRMTLGKVRQFGTIDDLSRQLREKRQKEDRQNGGNNTQGDLWRNSALLDLALEWLQEDFNERGPRGPRLSST